MDQGNRKFIAHLEAVATATFLAVSDTETRRCLEELRPLTEGLVQAIERAASKDDDEMLSVLCAVGLTLAAFAGKAMLAKQGEERMLTDADKRRLLQSVGLQ